MYQYPRSSSGIGPRPTTPGTSSTRSGNQREQLSDRSSDFESTPHGGKMSGESSALRPAIAGEHSDQEKDLAKLKQITQRFFTKAALTIVSSRVELPQAYHRQSKELRSNKWFNLILDESDQLAEEVIEWATVDVSSYRPNPLVVEIYLDANDLARNRRLVVVDERGKKWDVHKALDLADSIGGKSRNRDVQSTQIVLERWKISVGEPTSSTAFADSPPNVYKKAVVLFRALYSYLHLMPAWKLGRRIAKEPSTLTSLRPMYRILNSGALGRDTLTMPLYPSGEEVSETHTFPATRCPTGPLNIQVSYRANCDFRLADTDAALSSQFMGMDNQSFRPSINDAEPGEVPYWIGRKDAGSLPSDKKWIRNMPDPLQAYGSMSTYHNAGVATGTSPLSALRAARNITSETPPERQSPLPQHDRRPSQSSRSSFRSIEGAPTTERRVSISFQPFKAGSLSSSPGFGPTLSASPRTIGAGSSDISRGLAQARNRNSLNTLPQAALRAPPQASNEVAVGSPSPGSTAVRPPTTRFSSSFGNRRSRVSSGSGGASRTEEDNGSSVRGSQSSSNQPESGLLAEGGSGSSGSARTDEDNIADFLKMLDTKRDLRSFVRVDESTRDVSGKRTTAALSKYQRMRDSHAILSDSMSSSLMNLPRSSTSSSRGLPMLAGNSVSTSSSPGKPISPHTPHYPAIPSRLSANATIEDLDPPVTRDQPRPRRSRRDTSPDESSTTSRRGHGSTPMDIPTSPQRYPIIRRSSSAAQRRRASEDLDEFGLRSSSLPLEDRPDLSLSELLALQQREPNPSVMPARGGSTRLAASSRPLATDPPESSSMESQTSSRPMPSTSVTSVPPLRARFTRGGGGRGSPSSFTGAASGGSGEPSRAGRYATSGRPGTADDDEPLVFTMSEIGATAQARRGGEDGEVSDGVAVRSDRGGGDVGVTGRRGSRRGGDRSLW